MAKGEGVMPPMCRLCNEPHWRVAGEVCPKFRSPKVLKQPTPLRLAAPAKSKVAEDAKILPALPAPGKAKKPKRKAKKAKRKPAPPADGPGGAT